MSPREPVGDVPSRRIIAVHFHIRAIPCDAGMIAVLRGEFITHDGIVVLAPFVELLATPLNSILYLLQQSRVRSLTLYVGLPLGCGVSMILPLDPQTIASVEGLSRR